MSKNKAQREHARRRFRERFGVSFDRNKAHEFVKIIQRGAARFVERQSCRVTVFDVPYEGATYRVVYDKQRKNVVTVLA
jgi:predicted RNA-binding protein associated with RNAse of E/G family